MRALAFLGVLMVLLAACSAKPHRSPAMVACQSPGATPRAIQQTTASCTGLLRTARGDDLAAVLRARGEAYREDGNTEAAEQDFTKALALRPDDAEALVGRGMTLLDSGDPVAAEADLNHAIRIAPDTSGAYDNRGVAERRLGDYAAALRDENRAIELAPGSAYPWADRGLAYLARHEFELALADFSDALRIDADLAYALNGEGDAYRRKGDITDAVQVYNASATSYFNLQRYQSAIYEADAALAAKPDDPTSLNNRCWTRGVGNFELELALADCERSLKLRPGDAATLDSEAMVYFRKGDMDAAIAGYSAALRKDPKWAPSMFMRGVARMWAGETDEGQSDIDNATALDGTVAATVASYGITPKLPPGVRPAAAKGAHADPSTNAAQ
jgi:tetratricopeptide (TPR) repeat protein